MMDFNKIRIHDIETLKGLFLYMDFDPATGKWREFEVSEYRNQLDDMLKYFEGIRDQGVRMIGYNNLSFDSQVLEYIIRQNKYWYDLSNKDVIRNIFDFSQIRINASDDEFPPYKESNLYLYHIDPMHVFHLTNKNKRTKLKWLEFMMDMDSVEEMPFSHLKEDFTESEVEDIKDYCVNDIKATFKLYQYVIGAVEHPEYQNRNKLQDRLDLIEEFSFPEEAMNWSDVKIGDELNKRAYCKATNKTMNQVFEAKRQRKPFSSTYGKCVPKYVKFQTTELKDFYNSIKNLNVRMTDDEQEYSVDFKGTRYTIARGGIHSNEKQRTIVPSEGELLVDADVGLKIILWPN